MTVDELVKLLKPIFPRNTPVGVELDGYIYRVSELEVKRGAVVIHVEAGPLSD